MTDLLPLLTLLLDQIESSLAVAVPVFLRIGAAMALLPAFGEQVVPLRIRLVLTLAFTMVVAPVVTAAFGPDPSLSPQALVTEPLAGLAIGLGVRLFIHALQIAGAIAANAMSLSQLFASAGAEPQPTVTSLLTVAGLALAVSGGLHLRVTEMFVLSYGPLPPAQFPDPAHLADWTLQGIRSAFSLAFSLAAPFVIAAMVYNVALGAINRAMPQLMVSFVGAPALTLGGLALLALAAPTMLMIWQTALTAFLTNPFGGTP